MMRCTLGLLGALAFLGGPAVQGQSTMEVLREFDREDGDYRLGLDARIGAGWDSNPFLTPDEPYFDQARNVAVVPDSESGAYLPFRLRGRWGPEQRSGFAPRFRVAGAVYPDSVTGNADEYFVRVRPGYEWVLGPERRSSLWVTPLAAYNKEIFFDRDTGLSSVSGGNDISDRYSYTALGGEVAWSLERDAIEYEAGLRFQARDYSDEPGLTSLDQQRIDADVGVSWRANKRWRLSGELEYGEREYDERQARDATGAIALGAPELLYRYRELSATVRYHPSRRWYLYLDLERRDRQDAFVGYNDYDRDTSRLRASYRLDETRVRASLRYRERAYPDAFIFDEPIDSQSLTANPNKNYETIDLELYLERPLGGRSAWFVELDARDQESADPRFGYDRVELAAGVRWRSER